ncbi:uncharacterized protein LOC119462264 [Dermacentor silvarum]|uniref:uncharacterized protein LOC119462264 n=1 Tax=Dermacentor silvarum TaxID=543639 RepID=UPI00189B3DC0|nr:uncharacterized protein LOC119462264 [Dermacentor silvarum]
MVNVVLADVSALSRLARTRSDARTAEPTPGPGRQRASGRAKSRSLGSTCGASSVASGGVQPAALYDPAELCAPTGHEDPHVQTGCAMHMVPNLGRVSYIWHQSSSNAEIPAASSSRSQRFPSSVSFEAMQIAELGVGSGRRHMKHFEDTASYDPRRLVLPPEPMVADEGHDLEWPAERQPEQLAQKVSPIEISAGKPTRGVLFNSSRPLFLPPDGLDQTGGSDEQTVMATSGKRTVKSKMMSLLGGWHERVPQDSTSSRTTPSDQPSPCLLSVPSERPVVLEPRRVNFDVAIADAATLPRSDGTNEAANVAELQGRSSPAQEACGRDRTTNGANELQPNDPGGAAASASAAATSMETSSLEAEKRAIVSDSQPIMGRRETQPFVRPQASTMWTVRRSGAFLFSPTRVVTRDSAQQTDQ